MMSDPPPALVTLEDAGIRREGRWLVRGVFMAVGRGEIVTLIGPNGSGKSTTAKMALGLMVPDEGRAWRCDGLKVGYVPQQMNVSRALPLTVRRLMGLTAPLTRRQADAALARAGVAHLAGAEAQTLSGGEFRRVLLARAIAAGPDLLVLDEPVQGVDFTGEIALYELILSLRDELDCGVLLISHDLNVVMAATDTVLCLNGHVCCKGSPKTVAQSAEYHKLFGHPASGVLAVYEHSHDHTHLDDGRVRHLDGTVTGHCHPGDGHHAQDQVGVEGSGRGGNDPA
ncbi:Zinc ABC transporter, ATP-binding protein ZnuC [hydrothermal vent metagenome]|uniref:Zinc ABC transporter, ATP-binding protein ZnuC n=1 Tax=hydrothermal vent metagenome TaxID=652676 RepID=A0A3B0T0F0_9ZZZZ